MGRSGTGASSAQGRRDRRGGLGDSHAGRRKPHETEGDGVGDGAHLDAPGVGLGLEGAGKAQGSKVNQCTCLARVCGEGKAIGRTRGSCKPPGWGTRSGVFASPVQVQWGSRA